jgi:mono/diheme cytochrome c family protein
MNQKINRIRQILIILVLIAAVEGFSSCEKYTYTPPAVDPNTEWSLKTDIQPVFNASCVSCHGGTVSPDLRDGKSFNALTKGGYVNSPAETSRLYAKMVDGGHESRSTAAEKLKVLYWITQGAKNN